MGKHATMQQDTSPRGDVHNPAIRDLVSMAPDRRRAMRYLTRFVERAQPNTAAYYEALGTLTQNPNVSFRVYVYDPLMREAERLARTFEGDYIGLKQHLLNGRDLCGQVYDALGYPNPADFEWSVKWNRFLGSEKPGLPGLLGTLGELAPAMIDFFASQSWMGQPAAERRQIVYSLLLDKLEMSLERPGYSSDGGEQNSVLFNYLREESRKQEQWWHRIWRLTDGHPNEYYQLHKEQQEPPDQAWVRTVIIPKEEAGAQKARPRKAVSAQPSPRGSTDPAKGSTTYTFRRGETVWGKAQEFGYTNPAKFVKDFQRLNPGVEPGQVYAGSTYRMPWQVSLAEPSITLKNLAHDPVRDAVEMLSRAPDRQGHQRLTGPAVSLSERLETLAQQAAQQEQSRLRMQSIQNQLARRPSGGMNPLAEANEALKRMGDQPDRQREGMIFDSLGDRLGHMEHKALEHARSHERLESLRQQHQFDRIDPLRSAEHELRLSTEFNRHPREGMIFDSLGERLGHMEHDAFGQQSPRRWLDDLQKELGKRSSDPFRDTANRLKRWP